MRVRYYVPLHYNTKLLLTLSVAVDCLVGAWEKWGETDSSGFQTRIRNVVRININGGKDCPALNERRKGKN